LMSGSFVHKIIIAGCRCFASPLPSGPHQEDTMPKDNPKVLSEASRMASRRGRVYVLLFLVVLASLVAVGAVVSRGADGTSSIPSTDRSPGTATTTTAIAVSEGSQITSRLREIMKVRDRALLTRNARLLSDIYTVDCKCLADGKALIRQLRSEKVVWKDVSTDITIERTEEVNGRLWIVIASVRTPPVRIETEAGRLVRVVPAERNRVRFALAKPTNEEEWLLGHASSFS
jgi:hypothetical protein